MTPRKAHTDELFSLLTTELGEIRGKPLLRDANREQLEAMEYVVRNLPEQEQRQIYRRIARKMVDQFRLDSNVELNLRLEAEKAMTEEENS